MMSARKKKKQKSKKHRKLSNLEHSGNCDSRLKVADSAATPANVKLQHLALFSVAIVILTTVAYHNSLHGPFVFDDTDAIVENASIRDLSDIGSILSPPLSSNGAVGRPIVNLSFAMNFAISGTEVFGYHLTNLLIHICVALVLFGVIRRTLVRMDTPWTRPASPITTAGLIALLWAIHPLLTESVSSVVQRSESLTGLFFMLSLYCFIRSSETKKSGGWYVATVVFCFAGAATKEIMALCPVLLWLYDRTFISDTFRSAWQSKRILYVALFSSLGMILYLHIGTNGRNQTVGFGYGIAWWEYALTQCYGVANYLLLAFWPRHLIFDYGTHIETGLMKIVPGALLLGTLFFATVRAIVRRQAVGFLGACFFGILGPSSSIIPLTTQTLAEHRMYLPLIPVVFLVVMLLLRLGKKGMFVAFSLVPVLIFGTISRNTDYQSALNLWSDTVQKIPSNGRAHNDLGNALLDVGRTEDALKHFKRSIALNPGAAMPWYNMANTLKSIGRSEEAAAAYEAALDRNPNYAKAHSNLGNLLTETEHVETEHMNRAVVHFIKAARLTPDNVVFQMNAANGLMATGRFAEAVQFFVQAVRIDPANMDAINNLGVALVQSGDTEAAVKHYKTSIAENPKEASIRYNLGKILAKIGKLDAAIIAYRDALRLQPHYPEAHYNVGNIHVKQGRFGDAIKSYQSAVSQKPDYASALNNLGGAYKRIGETQKAQAQYERVLRIQPHHLKARTSLEELRQ